MERKFVCCGENKPCWSLHGGRFGEAGDHLACDSCLPGQLRWIMQHPRITGNAMVEVRIAFEINVLEAAR